jgi:hypothetical protein
MLADISATKSLVTIGALAATNGSTNSASFDTKNFSYFTLDVILGTVASTTNSPTLVKLTEADVTTSSSGATIAAFYMSTDATAAASPVAITGGANIYRFSGDLRPRKRYLFGFATPTTTQAVIFDMRLSRANEVGMPRDAASMGVQNAVQG